MPTITIRNVPPRVMAGLKSLARRHNRSMEQEVRELLASAVADRTSVLQQIESQWSRQSRRPDAAEIDAWLETGRR